MSRLAHSFITRQRHAYSALLHKRLFAASPASSSHSAHQQTYVFDPPTIAKIQDRIATFAGPIPLVQLPKSSNLRPGPGADPSRKSRGAAVLIPLANCNGQASVLFQLRTSTVSTHKGQVSFPGGHIEKEEIPIEAALREMREEMGRTGIGSIKILAECQRLPAVTGTMVTPVLAFIENDLGDLKGLSPSPNEVDEVFALSLSQLLDPSLRGREDLGLRAKSAPYFNGGPARVWGLTAFVMEGVLEQILRPVYGLKRYDWGR